MAEQGVVLDIDAKFIKNLQDADKALKSAATQADNVTKAFAKTLQGSGQFAQRMQDIYSGLAKLGNIDFSGGIAKIEVSSRTAADGVNLLSQRMLKLKEEYDNLAQSTNGQKSRGTNLRITTAADLENIAKLRSAITSINNTLTNKGRKKPLSLIDIQSLNEQRDLYRRALRELGLTDAERTKNEVDNANRRIKVTKQEAKEAQALLDAKYTKTPTSAINFANQAKSINQMAQAIKYLQTVRANINPTTGKGVETIDKINAKISELKSKMRDVKNSSDGAKNAFSLLNGEMQSMNGIASKLSPIMAAMFSVQAIRGYVNQLISVRGELELQQRALQAILQDKDEANRLWSKTIGLAVKSPFQIKELVTYTKQLAAYRVESDKLYDTTKMLADISAGLGVDMSRLILAYGQVKAANYLRGTELRQFSEAGINILDELATHFSALEGTTISVGEVFERVSKRMVSFEDVETVLKRVTSESGIFYRMQEIQAETLKGQISNLKDSIQLMLNDIGESNEGVLKGAVSAVRSIVENWRTVEHILEAIIGLITVVKLQTILTSRAMLVMAARLKIVQGGIPKMLTAMQGLQVVFTSLSKTVGKTLMSMMKFAAANPLILALVASLGIAIKTFNAFRQRSEKIDEINEKYKELSNTVKDLSIDFNKAFNVGAVESAKKKLEELIALANKKYGLDISIEDVDKSNLDEVNEAFVNIREKIFDAQEFAKALETELADREVGIINFSSGSGRDPRKQIKEFGDVAESTYSRVRSEAKEVSRAIQDAGIKLTSDQKRALIDISAPMGTEETKIEYINRIQSAYKTLSDVIATSGVKVGSFDDYLLESKQTVVDYGFVFDNLSKHIKSWWSEQEKAEYIKFAIDQESLAYELDETETNILYWIASRKFNLEITPTYNDAEEKDLSAWQKSYNDLVKAAAGFKEITDPATTRDTLISDLKDILTANTETLDAIKEAGENATAAGGAYEGVNVQDIEAKVTKAKELLAWLGVSIEDTSRDVGRSQKDWVNEVIKAVRDAHKEYNTLINDLKAVDSKSLALAKTVDVFNEAVSNVKAFDGINLGSMKFETEEGAIDALEMLKSKLPASARESRLAIEKAIGEIRGEVTISTAEENRQKLIDEINDMFSGYEWSIELGKLNVPVDWAASFYDIKTVDLSEIKERLLGEMQKVEAGGGDKKTYDKLREFLSKVDEMEANAQQERLKTYLQYARNSIGERAKIKLEELKKLQEIEMTFGDKHPEAKQAATEAVQKESYQKDQKAQWEEFQKTDLFVNLFDDLDNASTALMNHAIEKLEEFKEQWKDMPHEEMKSIVEKINNLKEQLYQHESPRQTRKALKAERAKETRTDEELQKDNIVQTEKILASQTEISLLEQALELRLEGNDMAAMELAQQHDRLDLAVMDEQELQQRIKGQQTLVKDSQKIIDNNNKNLTTSKQIRKTYADQKEDLEQAQQMANDLYNAFRELTEVLGGGDSIGALFADAGMQMANTVLNTIALQLQLKAAEGGAYAFGTAMNAAMGIIGWIVMAVQLVATVLKAIFAAKDKNLEKQIKKIGESVEVLQKQLEQIEGALDTAFSATGLTNYTRAAKRNIEAQIEAYGQMIKLESQKKKSDSEQIKQWQETMNELREKQAEIYKEAFSTASAGILDDAISSAEGFVDAWYEAFQETGDGLSGLEEEFSDMLLDLTKRQAALQIVGNYMEYYKNLLKKYIDPDKEDFALTVSEAAKYAEEVRNTFPQLSAALEGYMSAMNGIVSGTSGLSTLSQDIQGITETTAQAIEALLNSTRFYVADSNMRIQHIETILASDDVTRNPILYQLQQQTNIVTAIKDMFESVIGRGSSAHSGAYLKVVM